MDTMDVDTITAPDGIRQWCIERWNDGRYRRRRYIERRQGTDRLEPVPSTAPTPAPTAAELRSHGRMSIADLCKRLPPPAPAPAPEAPASPKHRFRPASHLPSYWEQLDQPATQPVRPVAQPLEPAQPITPLPLDYETHPHLVDLVAEHADLGTVLAFRLVSRAVKGHVDRVLERVARDHDCRFVVPRLEGHGRALLPPFTVVDRVELQHQTVTSQLHLPPRTRRHVVIVVFDANAPPIPYSMVVVPCIQDRGHQLRLSTSDMSDALTTNTRRLELCVRLTGREWYPDVLDLVFSPRGWESSDDTIHGSSPDAHEEEDDDEVGGLDDDDDDGLVENWDDAFDFEEPPPPRKAPAPSRFFEVVSCLLHVPHRLQKVGVRLWGLENLPPRLVKSSLPRCASDQEVAEAALRIIRNQVHACASSRAGDPRLLDITPLLARLSVGENDL